MEVMHEMYVCNALLQALPRHTELMASCTLFVQQHALEGIGLLVNYHLQKPCCCFSWFVQDPTPSDPLSLHCTNSSFYVCAMLTQPRLLAHYALLVCSGRHVLEAALGPDSICKGVPEGVGSHSSPLLGPRQVSPASLAAPPL